ncbi:MAG: hypothetical protein ACYC3S_15675 [Chloroflexota bacterium]
MSGLDQPGSYVVTIRGCIGGNPIDWLGPVAFASMVTDVDNNVTTLSGIVTDQAGIIGLIRHIHGLGVVLLSVERIASG